MCEAQFFGEQFERHVVEMCGGGFDVGVWQHRDAHHQPLCAL